MPDWFINELAHAGDEHLDADYVATYDRKAGTDPTEDVAVIQLQGASGLQTISPAKAGSLNIGDALQQYVPGVNLSEVTGNPFQPNVEFRGFVGSPVAGTPQGLAVYQNGVRINEAFGDTVNWDLIPTAAIR